MGKGWFLIECFSIQLGRIQVLPHLSYHVIGKDHCDYHFYISHSFFISLIFIVVMDFCWSPVTCLKTAFPLQEPPSPVQDKVQSVLK